MINNSTLRNGEQAPGVSFKLEEKLAIAVALEAAVVEEIAAGTPAMGQAELEGLAAVGRLLRTSEPIAWCRMNRNDVDAAITTGLKRVNLSVPLSDIQISAKLNADRAEVLRRIRDVISYAVDYGLRVALGGEDSSPADFDFVLAAVEAASSVGAHRYQFADTLGIMDTFSVHDTFRRLRSHFDLELEFHGHDDLGIATANTLAAIRGGATHARVCVLGLGELAGNAAMEEVVAGLKLIHDTQCRVHLSHLPWLAEIVANAACTPIPAGNAIVGANAFTHQSGIHVDGLMKNPLTYEELSPGACGRDRRIVLGKHSGMASVTGALHTLGLAADKHQTRRLLTRIQERPMQAKRAVSTEELLEFYTQSNAPLTQHGSPTEMRL